MQVAASLALLLWIYPYVVPPGARNGTHLSPGRRLADTLNVLPPEDPFIRRAQRALTAEDRLQLVRAEYMKRGSVRPLVEAQWMCSCLGPNHTAGRINSLAVHPTVQGRLSRIIHEKLE